MLNPHIASTFCHEEHHAPLIPKASLAALVAVATAGFSSAALAHVGDHSHMSFAEGLLHPFSGLDHVLAMVAVGLWASQLGGRALWLLPLTFPAVMAVGRGARHRRRRAAGVEIGIAGSVLVLGAAVALALRPSLAISVPLIGAVRAAARLQPRRRAAGERLGAELRRGLHRGDAGAARDRHRDRPDGGPHSGPLSRRAPPAARSRCWAWCCWLRCSGQALCFACRRAARKDQRLDHHRHRAGAFQHRADVDVVELLELEPVDRHHGILQASSPRADECRAGRRRRRRRPAPADGRSSARSPALRPRRGRTRRAAGTSPSPATARTPRPAARRR